MYIQLDYIQSESLRQFIGYHLDTTATSSYEIFVDHNNVSTLIPGISQFEFSYNGNIFAVDYKEEGEPHGDPPRYYRRLTISHPNIAVLKEFVSNALLYKKPQQQKRIKVYSSNGKGYWDYRDNVCSQSLENIFITPMVKESLLQFIDQFIVSKEKYTTFGRDYRTGFLLTGVPGSGKTSLVKAIALHYDRPIYILNFTKQLTDDRLFELIFDIKDNSILLIEDIDAFFVDRKPQDINVSFSALLNLLDGMIARGDGLLIFITANNPDRLDPALIRPGRIDKIVHFDYPKRADINAAFNKLVTNATPEQFESFYSNIKGLKIAMSGIIDYLFRHSDDYIECISELLEQTKMYQAIVNDTTDKIYL